MASLTFQDVIRFYPANNEAVYKDIRSALTGGRLVPFVGAGLSIFCGYKPWSDVLTELSGFIPDEIHRAEAEEMICRNQYLEAAEHIHKHYSPMMRRLLNIVSYSKIDNCPNEKLYGSAAWVLPRLFGNKPLMTTNFDGVLEHVFAKQNCVFERVVEPHDPSLLTQIRQNNTHSLFKLHGDIGRETTSIDRLVFTQSQYNEVYGEQGELIGELRQWYQNQTLLFLGCSLAMDKTMEVLRDVASKDPGIRHFAIIGCKTEQRGDLLERFGELGIDAIFYDESNHEAVRVILENLLYETNPLAYQQLDEEMCRFVGPVRRSDVLMYNAGHIKYVGRTEELAALERFCGSASTNEWWAVTGPGGIGKSRLVYEFTNKKQSEGWEIRWFSRDQYDQLSAFCVPVEDTIVVLDDIQADTQMVGSWLKSMRQHRRRNRLRILLLERDGVDFDSADWLRLLRSGSPYSDSLAQWCHDHTFLRLNPLENADLKAIMTDCAETLGKEVDAEALLTALVRVDKVLRRPLYALAVAEAACNGEDPIHWTSEQVLDEMLNRELAFHYESLKYILGTVPTRTQQQELENLMARCCIRSHLQIDEVSQVHYPYLVACMEGMSPREFFRCLGLLQTEKEREVLRMNCPDLIREHLVLRLVLGQGRMGLLLPANWQEDLVHIAFLHQLLQDHEKRLSNISNLWEPVLVVMPGNSEARAEYADLLWSVTVYSQDYSRTAVEQLEKLFRVESTNSRIRTAYAAGIFNTAVDLDFENRTSAERKLTELYSEYPGDRGIAFGLAKILCSLAYEQDLHGCVESIERLMKLSEEYPSDKNFASELAMGLCYLSVKQDVDGCIQTVKQLKNLVETYPQDRAFALRLAIGLRSLSSLQDLEGCMETVNQLTKLTEVYSGNRDFSRQLAIALGNLSSHQNVDESNETVGLLTRLSEEYPADRDFAYRLAIGLRNLSYEQELEACIETVKRLMELRAEYPEVRDIAIQLAIGLRNLSYKQDLNGRIETVNQLKELRETHPDDRDFAFQWAIGLGNLTFDQEVSESNETVNRLTAVAQEYSRDRDILLQLAIGLKNLSYRQEGELRLKTVDRLSELAEAYPNDREFALTLAKALQNLTCNQNEAVCSDVVFRITNIYNSFPGDQDIAEKTINAMVNLAFAQTTEAAVRDTLAKTEAIQQAYPEHTDIQLSHAMTWFNLTLVQEEDDICVTVSEIIAYLQTHEDIIPGFREALDKYLSEHPDHINRYQELLDLVA